MQQGLGRSERDTTGCEPRPKGLPAGPGEQGEGQGARCYMQRQGGARAQHSKKKQKGDASGA